MTTRAQCPCLGLGNFVLELTDAARHVLADLFINNGKWDVAGHTTAAATTRSTKIVPSELVARITWLALAVALSGG